MRGQRQLHQNAVDIFACVQLANQCQHFLGGDRFRRRDQLAKKPQRLAGLDLAAHINFRSWNMPYQHCRQPRPYALLCEALHLIPDLRLD